MAVAMGRRSDLATIVFNNGCQAFTHADHHCLKQWWPRTCCKTTPPVNPSKTRGAKTTVPAHSSRALGTNTTTLVRSSTTRCKRGTLCGPYVFPASLLAICSGTVTTGAWCRQYVACVGCGRAIVPSAPRCGLGVNLAGLGGPVHGSKHAPDCRKRHLIVWSRTRLP